MKWIFIIGIIFLLDQLVTGQNFYSRNFTINDGLPANSIKCIFKDSQDGMWLATGAGLCRFDGQKFMVYRVKDGLPGENIMSITEGRDHQLWIGCMKGGISCYDGKSFRTYSIKDGLVSDNVRVVWYSQKFDLLFVGTNDGCSVFDGKKFLSLTKKDSQTSDLYTMGFLEGEDFVNIYSYGHFPVYRFLPLKGKFISIDNSYYQMHNASCSPLVQKNGDTIIGSLREGINIIHNGVKQSFKQMGQVFDMKRGLNRDVWIACWSENAKSRIMPGGLYLYNGHDVISFSEQYGITDPTVWSLYYDTSFNLLWVGTLNSGLYKIPLPVFEWYDSRDFQLDNLNVTSLLSTRENEMWIGTKGNLIRWYHDGKYKIMDNSTMQRSRQDQVMDYNCIVQDKLGDIFTSCYQSPLIRYTKKDDYQNPTLLDIKPGCTRFALDTNDTIYYGDRWWDTLYHCSVLPVVSKPIKWLYRGNREATNYNNFISNGDTIWCTSLSEGLFRTIHGKTECFNTANNSLPRVINEICIDHQGNVIIGSNMGEVLILRYMKDSLHIRFRLFPDKEIIGNTIRFLVVDHSGHLYVGTNLGFNRIDLTKLYLDGRVSSNFYSSAVGNFDHTGKVATCDEDGNIWIGTDTRLMKINTRLLENLSRGKFNLIISKLEVNFTADTSFSVDKPLWLSHNQNNLIFHYDVTNYLNPEQTIFRYKLEGLSERWSEYSSDHKAVFNALSPGNYQLVVESSNPLTHNVVETASFSFIIRYPWYQNGWIIGLIIIVLIFIVLYIVRRRTNRIREVEQRKSDYTRQLATIEMRALQSQMNPHFIFNSINSIQGFIINNQVEEAREYLMDFARIIRQTLDNATREYISLQEELDYLKYYLKLELMRFDKKFTVDLRVPANVNPQDIQLPPMLIQPYVENAIRHGLMHKRDGKGLLLLEFQSEDDQYLHCIIMDNGVGREKSREIESWKIHTHKPQSTRITQDRIQLLNSISTEGKFSASITDLTDSAGNPTGTRVELQIPLRIL